MQMSPEREIMKGSENVLQIVVNVSEMRSLPPTEGDHANLLEQIDTVRSHDISTFTVLGCKMLSFDNL